MECRVRACKENKDGEWCFTGKLPNGASELVVGNLRIHLPKENTPEIREKVKKVIEIFSDVYFEDD